jgi:hypothetical protein
MLCLRRFRVLLWLLVYVPLSCAARVAGLVKGAGDALEDSWRKHRPSNLAAHRTGGCIADRRVNNLPTAPLVPLGSRRRSRDPGANNFPPT